MPCRILGIKTLEVTAGWRKLHHEELHDFYSTPNVTTVIIRRHISHIKYGRDEKCRQTFSW
jgi:hypothetical protein